MKGLDYCSFSQKVKREVGGSVRNEHLLSLNAAKELCMLSNCEKGKQIRQYFLEVEAQWLQQCQPVAGGLTGTLARAKQCGKLYYMA